MQKKLFIVLLLVACVALSGCALIVKDPVRDAQQVIIDVNGTTVDKATVSTLVTDMESQIRYEDYLNNYMYYMYYGMNYNPSSVDVSTAPQRAIDKEVQRLVLMQKFDELGLTLTEEDEAAIQEQAQSEYNTAIDQIKAQYLSNSEKEGDELTAEAQAHALTLDSRYTLDYFVNETREEKKAEKLREYAIRDVAVTDSELQTEYDSRVASAKETYTSTPDSFGTDVNSGKTVYYRPAGYRYVKQVLVGFQGDTSTALTEANSAVTTAQTAVNNAQSALDDNTKDLAAEDLTDERKAELEAATPDLQKALDDAKADLEQKQQAAAQALEAAYAAIKPTVDEVMAKVQAGEDFDALIEQYNTDPGMKSEPGKTNGYAIREGFAPYEAAFVEAGMALKNIGDVSEPVASDRYGYYIIRYQSDIEEGDVALDDVRDVISADLLKTKQDETNNATIEQWIKEANVKTYIERLSN